MNPMQMIGNNPVMQILNAIRNGNPQQVITNMLYNNPQFKNVMPYINGKNTEQLQQTFLNLCKEKGIDPKQFAQQFGMNLPIK